MTTDRAVATFQPRAARRAAAALAALVALAALAALSPVQAVAQAKVYTLNMERAIFTTKAAERRIEALNETEAYSRRKSTAKGLQERARDLARRLEKERATMSRSQREKLARQIQDVRTDLEHELKKMKELELEVLKTVRDELAERAERVVKQFIESEDIDILLRESPQVPVVLHVRNRYDLTAKVTERLNRIVTLKDD